MNANSPLKRNTAPATPSEKGGMVVSSNPTTLLSQFATTTTSPFEKGGLRGIHQKQQATDSGWYIAELNEELAA